ncbi:hypothetical protein CMI37_03260 [Candidatus Pacearchaeota archaeon]|nr:hypothetical protein [Candidatus Pacearchaeota archaeon]
MKFPFGKAEAVDIPPAIPDYIMEVLEKGRPAAPEGTRKLMGNEGGRRFWLKKVGKKWVYDGDASEAEIDEWDKKTESGEVKTRRGAVSVEKRRKRKPKEADDEKKKKGSLLEEAKKKAKLKKPKTAELGPEVRAQVLEGLRILAGADDGAVELDGQGFSKLDTKFGNSLAGQDDLTEAQAKAGIKLIQKYKGQLKDWPGLSGVLILAGLLEELARKKREQEEKRGKTTEPRTVGGDGGDSGGSQSSSERGDTVREDSGEQPYSEDGLLVARPEFYAAPETDRVPENLRGSLRKHQSDFLNIALQRFEEGHKTISNFDGTGAGKTRQEIGLAAMYAQKNPNSKVLLMTQSEGIINDAFARDAAAMGVKFTVVSRPEDMGKEGEGGIYITTYSRLNKLKERFGEVGLSVFDESHNLKNFHNSVKAKLGLDLMQASDRVGLFSATPIDKPVQIRYFCDAYGLPYQAIMKQLGYGLREQQIGKVKVQTWVAEVAVIESARRIEAFYDSLAGQGLAVKREVSMDNLTMNIRRTELTGADFERVKKAEENLQAAVAAAKGRAKGIVKAAGLMRIRRILEDVKIYEARASVRKAIAEGKQVVVFATRVNDTDLKEQEGGEEFFTPSTVNKLTKFLQERNLPFATVHGGVPKDQREQAVKDFQAGRTRVLLTTPQSGGTGISLDDTTGKNPRHAIIMTPPFSAMDMVQVLGRVNRLTTKSPATAEMLVTNAPTDAWNTDIIGNKLRTLGAAVKGDYEALDLGDIEAVQHLSKDEADAYLEAKRLGHSVSNDSGKRMQLDVQKVDTALKKKTLTDVKKAPAKISAGSVSATKLGDSYEVRFPFDRETITRLKSVSQKTGDVKWDKHRTAWVVGAQYAEHIKHIGLAKEQLMAQAARQAPPRLDYGSVTAKLDGRHFRVKFPFDTFAIKDIKEIAGGPVGPPFDAKTKEWFVPATALEKLEGFAAKWGTAPVTVAKAVSDGRLRLVWRL